MENYKRKKQITLDITEIGDKNVTARHTLENLSVLGAIDENSKLKRREKLQSTTRSRDALKSGGSGSLSDPWLGVEPSRDSEGRSRGLILTLPPSKA